MFNGDFIGRDVLVAQVSPIAALVARKGPQQIFFGNLRQNGRRKQKTAGPKLRVWLSSRTGGLCHVVFVKLIMQALD